MGKGIIREESLEDPGKRSRVEHRDAAIILKNLTGTKSIKGLMLKLPMLMEGTSSQATFRSNKKRCHAKEDDGNCSRRRRLSLFSWKSMYLSSKNLASASIEADFITEAFRRMQSLELLLLKNVKLSGGYENFPKRLTWLSWQGFPLKSIPANFYLGNLVVLELQNSSLQLAWKGTKFLPSYWNPTFWDCTELVEVERLFTIKPLRSVDIEMIKYMGLYDFESIESTQVEMTNCLTHTTRTGPLQGLYECGIFSIFLQGSTVPDRYSYKSMGTLMLSIILPSKLELKIRGLNLCVVYTRHPDRKPCGMYSSIDLKVSNETKGLMWAYRPVTIGSPIKNVDILWLSHWPFGKDDIESGEELFISVDQGYENLIKELGVQLVYEQENIGNTCTGVRSKSEDATVDQEAETPYWSQDDVVGDVSVSASKYQMWKGKYFLCNLRPDAYRDQFRWSQRNPALLDFSYEPDGPYNFLCEHSYFCRRF
ncbi:hypothetical protein M0R45_010501 [Rubus argutus]|uniref:Uncharacterized protein n=1 Tax=Rubus argutus TaxID=59490 RepID=A0AAW1Y786_RUBAR